MSKATQSDAPAVARSTRDKSGGRAPKLVQLERRLAKLRKLEAKRRGQLDAVQAQAARTEAEMAEVIAAVSDWVSNPEPKQ